MDIYSRGQVGGGVRRRAVILQLVRRGSVRSQGHLRSLLRRRGFAVAQPTLSRDVKDLGLARTPTGYAAPPEPSRFVPAGRRAEALDRVLSQDAVAVQAAGSLVVVRTLPGGAHTVARVLDEARLPGVAGTLAGDDTVFVATPGAGAALRLARRLRGSFTARRARA